MSTISLTPASTQIGAMPQISFEQLARQIYVAIITSLKDDKRVYEWVKNIEEQQRIEASKKLADSYRSWVPVAFTAASVACSVGLTIATINPQTLFNGLDWVTELFGCNNILNGFRQRGGGLNVEIFKNAAEETVKTGQVFVDGGRSVHRDRSEATRTELNTDREIGKSRYDNFAGISQSAQSEAKEAIQALQALNSEEAQAKRAMVR